MRFMSEMLGEKNDSRAPSRAWLLTAQLHTVQVKNIRLNFLTTLRFTVNYWGENKSLCEPSKQQKATASAYYWTMQNVLEKPSLMLLSRTSFILPSRHLPKKKHFNLYLSFPVYGPWTKRTVHVYKDAYRVSQRLKSVLIAAAQVISGYTKRCTLSIDRCFFLCYHMRSYLTAHRSDIKKVFYFASLCSFETKKTLLQDETLELWMKCNNNPGIN